MILSDSWTDRQPVAERVGAAEAVLTDLRAAIADGDLPVGTKLPSEAGLAARYAVSRSVVREALRTTTALGLTETRTGRGTFVVSDRTRHEDIFGGYSVAALREARPHIEVPAAALAASRRTSAQLRTLRSLVDRMDDDADDETWVELDSQFHLGIAEASGNPVFVAIVGEIRGALAAQSKVIITQGPGVAFSRLEHRAILDAIAARSGKRAAAAMSRHLTTVDRAVGQLFPTDTPAEPSHARRRSAGR